MNLDEKKTYYAIILGKLFEREDYITLLTGGYSLERLLWFLNGYIAGLSEGATSYITFMSDFYSYIEQCTNIHISPRGLTYELEAITNSQADAVKEFYKLLHGYYDFLKLPIRQRKT